MRASAVLLNGTPALVSLFMLRESHKVAQAGLECLLLPQRPA